MSSVDIVDDGKHSYHDFSLLQEDGVTPVANVEALKYKVSDGFEDLVLWKDIIPTPTGTIEIPGPINRISNNRFKRYLTLFAVHDGGKHLPQEHKYLLRDAVGITKDTVPTTE